MSERKQTDQYLLETRNPRATLRRTLQRAAKRAGNSEITQILLHALHPRKYLCAMMAVGAYEAAGGQDGRIADDIAAFTEAVNLGWILVDDIVDEHSVRFGKPTARALFGDGKTLMAALYLMSYGYARVGQYPCQTLDKLARTYAGWLDRDLMTGKSIQQCKRALQDLGSCYGAFTRVAAEIAGAPQPVQKQLEQFGQDSGYALTVMGECFDLKGQPGRPVAEEYRHGNDVYLVRTAQAENWRLTKPAGIWNQLTRSKAHKKVTREIATCLTRAEDTLSAFKSRTAILTALLKTVRNDLAALE